MPNAHTILTSIDRIVIPPSLQADMLSRIHAGHQGIIKCRQIAQGTVWWPTINVDIEQMCKTCAFCDEHKPSRPHAPMMPSVLPTRVWEKIGVDIFEYKRNMYLAVMDYYS